MNRNKKVFVLLMVSALVSITGLAWAQGLKERMQQRLPEIIQLKASGIVGENNQGYLAHLEGHSEKKELVAAENKDRATVYEAIAKKQGTSANLVGQRRALQLADKAKKGEWYQNANGKWLQK